TSGVVQGSDCAEDPLKLLSQLIGHQLIVRVSDQRLFKGRFVCIDRQTNLVLDQAHESGLRNRPPRDVGLIMIALIDIVTVMA
ncbi:hypothetical protein PPACK8108_LOCUS888, partial [Phakopsora pachyrhizi]